MAYEVAIGWDNRIDTAVLTATNQVSTLQVGNLRTADVREIWRASDNTVAIRADFGSPVLWGGTALVRSNAIASDTMRIGLSTNDATGLTRDAYDSGTIPSGVDPTFGMLVHFPLSPVVGRHLRIDLTQASLPEAGRWFAGPVWFPSRAFAYGWRPLWRDESRHSVSLGQAVHIDRKLRQRGFGFTLRGITEAEADDQVHEINRIAGTSRDILVCRNLTAGNLGKATIWGMLAQMIAYPQDHPDFYSAEIEVWERI
jgi:hypothetical protein